MLYYIFANDINIGDLISYYGIKKLLKLEGMCLFCDKYYVRNTKKILKRAEKDDFFIIGGGGLFKDYFMPLWNQIYKNRKNTNYILWGIGLNEDKIDDSHLHRYIKNIKKRNNMIKWYDIVKYSKISSFRDLNTYKYFSNISNIHLTGCPSINFLLDYYKLNDKKNKKYLLQSCHTTLLNRNEKRYLDNMLPKIAKKMSLEYIYTDNNLNNLDFENILNVYKSSEITVSSRLHGCIIALCFGSNLLAISKNWKIEGFLNLIKSNDVICDFYELKNKLSNIKNQKKAFNKLNEIKKNNINFSKKVLEIIN